MKYCGAVQIAPSQLILRSWGFLHALQVLADLSAIKITEEMVRRAFSLREVGEGSRCFELIPRPGEKSPVELPDWRQSSPHGDDHYFFYEPIAYRQFLYKWSSPGFESPKNILSGTFAFSVILNFLVLNCF